MTSEKAIVIYLFALLFIEIIFDLVMWLSGKSDKPASTILRGIGILVLIYIGEMGGIQWWRTLVFSVCWYAGFFDYAINIVRGLNPWHVGNKKFLYERVRAKMGPWIELFIKIWLVIVGYSVMFKSHWI